MENHKILIHSRIIPIGRLLDIGLLRRSIRTALGAENVDKPCQVSVLITDNREIREINRAFRQVDKPTDVLSFPMLELTPGQFDPAGADYDRQTGRVLLGDIVLSYNRIKEQARRFGQSTDRESSYLVIHSVLHLLGYDHLDEGAQKRRMRAREKAILTEMGLTDMAQEGIDG